MTHDTRHEPRAATTGGTPAENQTSMMYPEMMEIVIKSHHRYLRSLAQGDSFLDDVQHLFRLSRNVLGRGMVRIGRWIGGQAPAPADAVPATT